MLPRKYNPGDSTINSEFNNEMDELKNECLNGEAIIVFFKNATREYLPSLEEINQELLLPATIDLEDAVILGSFP